MDMILNFIAFIAFIVVGGYIVYWCETHPLDRKSPVELWRQLRSWLGF